MKETKELNEKATDALKKLKPVFEDVKVVGDMIKCNNNKLDKEFYLDMEDQLGVAYEQIAGDYFELKTDLALAIASLTTLLRISYKNDKQKIPGKELLENEAIADLEDLFLVEGILEGREKVTRNWIQTCRSHINALKGKLIEGE